MRNFNGAAPLSEDEQAAWYSLLPHTSGSVPFKKMPRLFSALTDIDMKAFDRVCFRKGVVDGRPTYGVFGENRIQDEFKVWRIMVCNHDGEVVDLPRALAVRSLRFRAFKRALYDAAMTAVLSGLITSLINLSQQTQIIVACIVFGIFFVIAGEEDLARSNRLNRT